MEGAEFKQNRLALNKSQEKMADDFECSVDTVRRWERNGPPGAAKWYFKYHGIM